MQRIYRHHDRFEVYRVFNMLEEAGIPCFVKNELIQGAIGDVPPQDSEPEVWLKDNEWKPKAQALIDAFEQEQKELQTCNQFAWICTACKEDNEANFNICWQCSGPRA